MDLYRFGKKMDLAQEILKAARKRVFSAIFVISDLKYIILHVFKIFGVLCFQSHSYNRPKSGLENKKWTQVNLNGLRSILGPFRLYRVPNMSITPENLVNRVTKYAEYNDGREKNFSHTYLTPRGQNRSKIRDFPLSRTHTLYCTPTLISLSLAQWGLTPWYQTSKISPKM